MTEWFEKTANGPPTQVQYDGSVLVLLGDDTPDWVTLPEHLGGQRVPVERAFIDGCPHCSRRVRHLALGGALHVAECSDAGFLWYKRKPQKRKR